MYISFLSPTEIFSYSVQFSHSVVSDCVLIIHFSDYITLIDINNRVLDYPSNNGHFKLFKDLHYYNSAMPCFPFAMDSSQTASMSCHSFMAKFSHLHSLVKMFLFGFHFYCSPKIKFLLKSLFTCILSNQLQLTLEQHWFELCRFTCTWIFFISKC